jgi:hypothetical protein
LQAEQFRAAHSVRPVRPAQAARHDAAVPSGDGHGISQSCRTRSLRLLG